MQVVQGAARETIGERKALNKERRGKNMSEALKLCIKNRRIMRKAVRGGKKRKANENERKSLEKKAKKAAKEAKDQKRKEWKEERDKFLKSLDGSVEGVKKFWKYWAKLKKEGGKEDRTELQKEGRVVKGGGSRSFNRTYEEIEYEKGY